MNYRNTELVDELAAQYAVGTLRGSARLRFERLCRDDPKARHALHRWEDRLAALASGIAPVQPSDAVWRGVQRRIRGQAALPRTSRTHARWGLAQMALAASALLAVAVSLWLAFVSPRDLVATIADGQQSELWRIEATAGRESLRIGGSDAIPADAQHAYELWALPASGAAPVSLGILPQRGTVTLQLNPAQRAALAAAARVAVSREPPGGSTTGAPTGPVLYVASVAMES